MNTRTAFDKDSPTYQYRRSLIQQKVSFHLFLYILKPFYKHNIKDVYWKEAHIFSTIKWFQKGQKKTPIAGECFLWWRANKNVKNIMVNNLQPCPCVMWNLKFSLWFLCVGTCSDFLFHPLCGYSTRTGKSQLWCLGISSDRRGKTSQGKCLSQSCSTMVEVNKC